VANLVSDAERLAEAAQNAVYFVVCAGESRAQPEGDFEGRRSLPAKDVQNLERAQGPGPALPVQLRALSEAKLPMAVGGDADQFGDGGRRGARAGQQTIAVADQQVAGVEGDGNAVRRMQRLLAVALVVVVFDVVVDQRCLVETLDGHGDLPESVRNRGRRIVLQRAPGAHGKERTPALAG